MIKEFSRVSRVTGILLLSVTTVLPSGAQPDTSKLSFLNMSLEELLDQEVVSASRMMEKSADAPATIHLITEEQIRARGYQNLEEVLEDIPGIEVQKKASVEYSNYFSIRGIDGSEKFIIMMDGMRIHEDTRLTCTVQC